MVYINIYYIIKNYYYIKSNNDKLNKSNFFEKYIPNIGHKQYLNLTTTNDEQVFFITGFSANNRILSLVTTHHNILIITNYGNETAMTGTETDDIIKLKLATEYFQGIIISNYAFSWSGSTS